MDKQHLSRTRDKILKSNVAKEARLSFRLAWLYIVRGRKWTLALTIFLMSIAFINLVFMSSLLNGIITDTNRQVRDTNSGEIYLRPSDNEKYIADAEEIVTKLEELPNVKAVMPQLTLFGELNLGKHKAQAPIKIVDSKTAKQALALPQYVTSGEFIDGKAEILLGYQLVAEGDDKQIPRSLEGAKVGDEVELKINGFTMPVKIGGVFRSKFIEADQTAFISTTTWHKFVDLLEADVTKTKDKIKDQAVLPEELSGKLPSVFIDGINEKLDDQAQELLTAQDDFIDLFPKRDAVDTIVIRTTDLSVIDDTIAEIKELGISGVDIFDWNEAAGFVSSINDSFVGIDAIMLVVGIIIAAVTIFIVIYVDVINKKRQIGIQRAIGVKPRIIVFSYLLLSMFYAFCGVIVGIVLFYSVLVPYFIAHPLDIPVADVSLNLAWEQLLIRAEIVMVVSIISGLVPSILASRAKILDSILGRG